MKSYLLLILMSAVTAGFAQNPSRRSAEYIDASAGIGQYRGALSVDYGKSWFLGRSKKFGIGLGIRYTGFAGVNLYYITAPAKLTSESTSPLIFFKENNVKNLDSLLVKSPQAHALNLMINLSYLVSERVTIGFNIDVFGASFGARKKANYINGAEGKNTTAKPTPLNILLISDNDRGTLNSELYVKYFFNDRWGAKLGGQFLFTEYTTKIKVQQYPEENDRFRNKALLLSVGVTRKL
jgi:hypothetical protein